ncbi:M23 family peptidase, partial [Clostridium botulinum C/D]|nr:M23 family peptidase [Clostridium botulinum C/D]
MGNYNSQYENYYRGFVNKNNNRINKERAYNGHN